MDWLNLSSVADYVGIIAALIGVGTWINTRRIREDERREQDRLNEKVKLVLKSKDGSKVIELPGEMRRDEVTRAEVLGWVGMLQMVEEKKGKRFDIAYTNSAEFLTQLSDVQTGNGDVTFEIECTPDELRQFAVGAIKSKKKKRTSQS